jgi:hypothetical protein
LAWPAPLEEQILLAAFAPAPEAREALEHVARELAGGRAGDAVAALLRLVYRRWPETANQAVRLGQRAYLATWRKSRERMAMLGEVAAELERSGIQTMALKGAALVLRHYRDAGLRDMSDFDILVRDRDVEQAARVLGRLGYLAEEGCTPEAIRRQAAVRHAWQFFREPGGNCDLHWRPLSRCYSPEVTREFWECAEPVRLHDREILAPSATHLLFQVCAHGLQWDRSPKARWVADALTVLREPVDWAKIRRMAEEGRMSCRLAAALAYLRRRFHAPVPDDLPALLERTAAGWERREYRLLLKPCPLGALDSLAWHGFNFRRLRPFHAAWRKRPLVVAFPQYLAAFLDTRGWVSFWRRLGPHLRARYAHPPE